MRVGNAANLQVQLDVFGPVVDLILALADRVDLTDPDWQPVRGYVPGHGPLLAANPTTASGRSAATPATTSTPRSCAGSPWTGPSDWRTVRPAAPPSWPGLRESIAAEVLVKGWNDGVQSFTAAYGGPTWTRPGCTSG